MSNNIIILRTVAELREKIYVWRKEGYSIGLVPTMGALHEGHFSLVEQSKMLTDRTITTLFVNPKQFGSNEDIDFYPRDERADAAALEARDVDILFAPFADEMYGAEFGTTISVLDIGDHLEGAYRPGFFVGVATVVAKLLIQSLPDKAFFGEKDFQQLCVIKRMVIDLDIPVEIVNCPTIRQIDGLALSSRNVYLSELQLENAPALYRGLKGVSSSILSGIPICVAVKIAKEELLSAGFDKVDYMSVCDVKNLAQLESTSNEARVFGAAWMGNTRLIDNVEIG
jgi:pantoate--beta-alanine ligase